MSLFFLSSFLFFFFNNPAPTEIYPLSLHDALPISSRSTPSCSSGATAVARSTRRSECSPAHSRSEEHTSELQSLTNLVCRLLLEKKKKDCHRHVSVQRRKKHDHNPTMRRPFRGHTQ